MNRRQLFLSTARAALASAFGGAWFGSKSASAQAQATSPAAAGAAPQTAGVLGSPDATTTIDGKQLPPPPPQFGGVIKETAEESTPWWPPRVVPPKGAPNVLLIMTDDQGYGVSGTFGGVIPTPALDRVAKAGLRYTQFHSTALCSPTRAALITGRNHHEVGFGVIAELSTGYPGYDAYIGPESATIGRILHGERLRNLVVRQEPQYAGLPNTRALTTSGRPGMGFEYFYGFMGGETDQWTPYLFRDHTQIFPWVDKPGYNLITDMADEAITHMRKLNVTAPEQPFFVYYVPGGSHSPHQPTQEWIDKFKGKFDMGWNELREQIFANQKRLGVIPPNDRADRMAGHPAEVGNAVGRREEAVRQAGGGVRAPIRPTPTTRSAASSRRSRIKGKLDNTLIIYICGDNGTSPEGTLVGTPNEFTAYNGFLDVPIEEQMKYYDIWGSAPTYPHMAVAWSWAFDTPFKWTKQIASHFGGTRQGLAISWPDRIKDAGGIRTQFHHIIDIVPTILEAAGITAPQIVDGIEQKPIEGVSMAYTWDKANADAPSTRTTQYFEMVGQSRHLSRRLVRQHHAAGPAMGAECENARRQRLQMGALQHQGRLLPGQRPRGENAGQAQGDAGPVSRRGEEVQCAARFDNSQFQRAIAPRPSADRGRRPCSHIPG